MSRLTWSVGERLQFHIENYETDEAHTDLDRCFDEIVESEPRSLTYRKYRCVSVLNRCTHGARRGGAPAERVLQLHGNAFRKLDACKRWAAVKRFLHTHVDEMLALINANRKSDLTRFIAHMRDDMRRSLATPRTLNQYSQLAGVNRSYLSRQFAAIVGRTFREELGELRLAEACRLLSDTPLKVRAVGRSVGLADASQFSALFRRLTGLSPSEYRLRQRQNAS